MIYSNDTGKYLPRLIFQDMVSARLELKINNEVFDPATSEANEITPVVNPAPDTQGRKFFITINNP